MDPITYKKHNSWFVKYVTDDLKVPTDSREEQFVTFIQIKECVSNEWLKKLTNFHWSVTM